MLQLRYLTPQITSTHSLIKQMLCDINQMLFEIGQRFSLWQLITLNQYNVTGRDRVVV